MFACILGVFVSGFLIIFIGISLLIGSISFTSTPTYTDRPNTVLYLKLEGTLQERTKEDPLAFFDENTYITPGLDDILKAIKIAQVNPNISGIYIEANGFSGGYASIDEIRQALKRFKTSGKFIIAYGDNYTQPEYYLAAAADSIFLNPVGMLDFKGLASERIFFKNTLDKVGVKIQVFKVGTFKSAVEPYISTQMSDANKQQTNIYLRSIWSHVVKGISADRKLAVYTLNNYADSLILMQDGKQLLQEGLIDGLSYRTDIEQKLADLAGVNSIDDLNIATVPDIVTLKKYENNSKNKIAVLYATGEIDGINSTEEGIDSQKLVSEMKKIQDDASIVGVVLRVNSPGGSAFGSEQLWAAVNRLRKVKPVAVSMGDYAASGGYYISCDADRIFADPATLTGSIGIFGLVPDASELLTDKLGLTFDGVQTNRYGNFPVINRPMNNIEKKRMQEYVERGYNLFIKRCAEGRKKQETAIRNIAEGRVWAGADALHIGLVDQLGSLSDAVKWIAKKASVTDYKRVDFPAKKNIYEEFIKQLTTTVSTRVTRSVLGENYRYYMALKKIQHIDPIQTRCDDITIE